MLTLVGLMLALGGCVRAASDAATNPSWPDGVDTYRLIAQEFVKYDPDYVRHRVAAVHRIDALQSELIRMETGGLSLPCSRQILIEARWALTNTAAWSQVEEAATRLADSLALRDQAFAHEQSPETGLWSGCYRHWFHQIDASVDAMNTHMALGLKPAYPVKLLRAFGTPAELIEFLERLRISRIAETGVDNRDALGVALAALSQAIFKPELNAFVSVHSSDLPIGDGYSDEFRRFLDRTQDPKTGLGSGIRDCKFAPCQRRSQPHLPYDQLPARRCRPVATDHRHDVRDPRSALSVWLDASRRVQQPQQL